MAIKIQDGGAIATRLQKLLSIQGRLAPDLEEFIIATIQVADLSQGGIPPVSRRAAVQFLEAAVVGELTAWRFEMPGSTLAIVRYLEVMPAADDLLQIHFGSEMTPPANQSVPVFIDGRIRHGTGENPAGVVFSGTQIGGLTTPQEFQRVDADPSTRIVDPGWIIGSGLPEAFDFLEFSLSTPNQGTRVTMEWDEYQIF